MKTVTFDPNWPESWKYSHPFDLQEIYGKITHYGYAYAYQVRHKYALDLIEEVLPVGATVLDIAAAQGNFTLKLAEDGYRVTWNDLRSELEGYVRLKYERGSVKYQPGNAFELKFPELFDAILITEIIEHVAHPDEFLIKAASLVKSNGYIVMTTPNGGYFRNNLPKYSECPDPSIYESKQFKPNADGHIFLLHEDEIYSLAEKTGLFVDKIILFTNSLTNGHLKTSGLLKILPRSLVMFLEVASQKLPKAIRKKTLIQFGVRFRKR